MYVIFEGELYSRGDDKYAYSSRLIKRESAAIVMNISYGYQISPEDDYYVSLADKALATLGHAGLLGTYLVDYIPARKSSLFPSLVRNLMAL